MNAVDHLKAAFDDSCVPQIVIGLDGGILTANEPAWELLGETKEGLLQKRHHELISGDPLPLEELLQKFDSDNYLQNWQHEFQYLRKDNPMVWVRVSISAIRQNGKAAALLAQLQDITDQKQIEVDLHRNSDDLDQFAYIASHDLREPLTVMAGYATLLKKRCYESLDEKGKHFLEEVIDSTVRMERKIDDLLAFSRAGRTTPKAVFQLETAIEEARRSVGRSIEESGAVFIIPEGLPFVSGDRSMIAQVFQNLFSNSIKYRNPDSPPIITVAVTPHDDIFLRVSVSDNGLGFDMEHKDRIFGVFQRLYTEEQYPGTGIGLAIVKRIVERHRGAIWTTSEPNHGATFFFTIPRADA